MYDFSRIRCSEKVTVGELVDCLSSYPRDAQLVCCGDDRVVIHIEEDDSVVNIDTELLEDEYEDFDETVELKPICPIIFSDKDIDIEFNEIEEEN